MASWDAAQYERFADHRTRPFVDLLSRIRTEPTRVLDLGCGNGLATLLLADRWPDAEIVGLDSSAEMLRQALEHDTERRVTWHESTIQAWWPRANDYDLIVTNAALQWVPEHVRLMPSWVESLPTGGTFAMQVPGNFGADSHRIIREVVADHPRADDLTPLLRHDPVLEPIGYAQLLASCASDVDVWETTYVQLLDPEGSQENPVLEWVKGTALRPILDELWTDETGPFLDDLGARLAEAYPRTPYGIAFPFRRIFAVAVR